MPDYSQGKIYTIRCRDDPTLFYVGSTTQRLSQRWTDHKSKCSNETLKDYNRLIYVKMREVGQDKFYIELYEDFPCERRDQLTKREGEIMRDLKPNLNTLIAGRTIREYYNETKENLKQKYKEYYIAYRLNNKEKIKEGNKIYYTENKEKIKVKEQKYYEEHKNEINQEKAINITCECGCQCRKSDIAKHKKTQKHITLMNIQNQESN